MAEWRTDGMLSARTQALSFLLYVSYIIVCNLLVLNLLIALLNYTFTGSARPKP